MLIKLNFLITDIDFGSVLYVSGYRKKNNNKTNDASELIEGVHTVQGVAVSEMDETGKQIKCPEILSQ